jgi:hypothetical protein
MANNIEKTDNLNKYIKDCIKDNKYVVTLINNKFKKVTVNDIAKYDYFEIQSFYYCYKIIRNKPGSRYGRIYEIFYNRRYLKKLGDININNYKLRINNYKYIMDKLQASSDIKLTSITRDDDVHEVIPEIKALSIRRLDSFPENGHMIFNCDLTIPVLSINDVILELIIRDFEVIDHETGLPIQSNKINSTNQFNLNDVYLYLIEKMINNKGILNIKSNKNKEN